MSLMGFKLLKAGTVNTWYCICYSKESILQGGDLSGFSVQEFNSVLELV